MPRRTAGVILAAGRAERFGGDKLLAEYKGTPLLHYSASLLASLPLDRKFGIIPAANAGRQDILSAYNIPTLLSPNVDAGQGVSTALAAQHVLDAGFDHLLVILADMPFVTAEHCRALLSRASGSDWVFSKSQNVIGPPAVISGAGLQSLTQLKADRGAKSIAPADEILTVDLPPEQARDMDTPEDFYAVKYTLLFFGRFCDLSKPANLLIPDNIMDTDSLTAWLSQNLSGFEALYDGAGANIAVNKNIIHENMPLQAGDEVAFMSTMSGG